MRGGDLAEVGPVVVSVLAFVLSLLNLYLQRRDRRPRLKVRVRYEYRVGVPGGSPSGGPPAPQMHDETQEGLYMRLGDFLREHGVEYPRGSAVVRFSITNEGERVAWISAVRLVFREREPFGRRMVLDPVQKRTLPQNLARDAANVAGSDAAEGFPVELVPGNGVGYRFSLTRLANTLEKEGHAGNVRLSLEATDRLGNAYRRSFRVNTDLWAYHEGPDQGTE
ncbi:hypothetical protein GBA63_04065 [Rubrobacter tropicus]|uniref:Uncharacterized protein n=1 Tax=Rubrobacter tropicus TaxID=2653851 RepID=A0A6G8Q6F7_9ACTN|nr:hypothetical protein [Rubrobacter tropicus]QIN81907.1 hypothetical protein GBA63_04065 [Rubrobacter tropicus]